jgi:hypothetical protein
VLDDAVNPGIGHLVNPEPRLHGQEPGGETRRDIQALVLVGAGHGVIMLDGSPHGNAFLGG